MKINQGVFDEVNQRAMGILELLLRRWFPEGHVSGREFLCGDWAGSSGSSLSINLDTGRGGDFASGEMAGDPVGIYAKRFNVSRVEALRALAEEVGYAELKDDDRYKKLAQIASECISLKDTPAALYLKEVRKLKSVNARVFRFRPHKSGAGSLVCLAYDANGKLQALQQVYIDAKGHKIHDPWARAEPKKPVYKRTNGFPAANPVRIPAKADGAPIIVCEGPEDGITLANATGYEVWVTCSVVFMDKIPLIKARQYIIARDNDEIGSEADIKMSKALANLLDRGFKNLFCARPPEGVKDANKLLEVAGLSAVQDMVKQAQPVTNYQSEIIDDDAKSIFEQCASFQFTDQGNAQRIALRWGKKVMYTEGIGWHIYQNGRWSNYMASSRVVKMIQMTHCEIINEQPYVSEQQKRAVKIWWQKSQNWPQIRNALKLIESNLAIGVDLLDNDPFLFNVENGVIDLQLGKLMPHNPLQYLTKQSKIIFAPEAQCPVWERFLGEIFPDNPEIIPFIQRAVGYSLSGDTSEQCMFILHGYGSNGKSTFLDTLQCVLGDYWTKTKAEAFMERNRTSDANPFVAMLRGARFATASETKLDRSLDESLVKETTGDSFITVRNMYQMPFTFQPQFKLWLATNHKPEIKGTDEGIWRRLRLIPFRARFYDADDAEAPNCGPFKDKALMTKLKAELPGILAWAVRGCVEWRKSGLRPPLCVQEATQEYRREMDIIGTFFEDCCDFVPEKLTQCKEIYEVYKRWCEENGHYPLSKAKLGRRIYERGHVNKGWLGGAKAYEGIGIKKECLGWSVLAF